MVNTLKLSDIRMRKGDKIDSPADVARILSMRKGRLSFGDVDLEAIKPFIACAACLTISAATTMRGYRF